MKNLSLYWLGFFVFLTINISWCRWCFSLLDFETLFAFYINFSTYLSYCTVKSRFSNILPCLWVASLSSYVKLLTINALFSLSTLCNLRSIDFILFEFYIIGLSLPFFFLSVNLDYADDKPLFNILRIFFWIFSFCFSISDGLPIWMKNSRSFFLILFKIY